MDRKLIDYYPPVVREFREMKAITDGQQVVISTLWDRVGNALADQFIQTATLNGIQRWEKILSIRPKGSDTLEDRRFRIRTRLNEQLPFTLSVLKNQLSTLCGEDGYSLDIQPGEYLLRVRVALEQKSNYQDVEQLLLRVVPAAIVIDLSLKYNTYGQFAGKTHGELAVYTHDQLRNEVMFGG